MTEQPSVDEQTWPRNCPACGTELQSHTTGVSPAATADRTQGVELAVVAEDFCPNPDCPTRQENAPGSAGGDNGGG